MDQAVDYATLKSMVLAFRVTELQMLLQWANKNKSGKKNELQQRAVDLIRRHASPSLIAKIRELHKLRYHNQEPVELYDKASSYNDSRSYSSNSSHSTKHQNQYGHESYQSMPCLSHFSTPSVMNSPVPVTTRGPPPRVDVQFQLLPFFDILDILVKPCGLSIPGQSRFQESTVAFQLSCEQANKVSTSKVVNPSHRSTAATAEYNVQIQLRFSLAETTSVQTDHFPPNCCVKVNGKMCPLPQPVPSPKPGTEAKRPPRPVNITNLCKLSPVVSNSISISWSPASGHSLTPATTAYATTVHLVRKLSATDLQARVKAKGARDADHTRAMVKDKLRHDADSEIATMSLKGSLLCPLGKMRLQFPCRASTCQHIQCFDGLLYLQMNEKRAAWTCPVCDKIAHYADLFLDGMFLDILDKVPSKCEQVEFTADGDWKPLGDEVHVKKEKKTEASAHDVETIVEDDSDGDVTSPSKKRKIDKKPAVEDIICLSSDDDEDDDETQDGGDANLHFNPLSANEPLDLQQLLDMDSSSLDHAFGAPSMPSWTLDNAPSGLLDSRYPASTSFRPTASSIAASLQQSQAPTSSMQTFNAFDVISIDDD
ncbi:E3 SUMO-protein ligase PIAS1 [Halotydeus destructor]|nr:E3 SUMO-protein ligase PIAS1 [Halotydeus destructor]